jgi:3-hydroxyacyl-CoA dehydrogenase / enoyl-CoA hydratase / 3-hydroxybutyryl-CoA epimerase
MTMMLTGKSAHAKKAKKLGLVDAVVEERHVANAVSAALAGKYRRGRGTWKGTAFLAEARARGGRQAHARQDRRKGARGALSRALPADRSVGRPWRRCQVMQQAEIASFSRLLAGQTSRTSCAPSSCARSCAASARSKARFPPCARRRRRGHGRRHRGVVRAQGADRDARGPRPARRSAKAIGRAAKGFDKSLHSGIERRDALDRLVPDFAGDGVAKADVIIEAVAEKTEVKHKVLAEVAARAQGCADRHQHVEHPARGAGGGAARSLAAGRPAFLQSRRPHGTGRGGRS